MSRNGLANSSRIIKPQTVFTVSRSDSKQTIQIGNSSCILLQGLTSLPSGAVEVVYLSHLAWSTTDLVHVKDSTTLWLRRWFQTVTQSHRQGDFWRKQVWLIIHWLCYIHTSFVIVFSCCLEGGQVLFIDYVWLVQMKLATKSGWKWWQHPNKYCLPNGTPVWPVSLFTNVAHLPAVV